jgi:hypothetical protein
VRTRLEKGAVFADPELPGAGDPFGWCQNMNLDLQLLAGRDGRETSIVVGGGEREPRDALGEGEGIVKTAGASAQPSMRVQRDKGSPPLEQRGFDRRRHEP